MTTARDIIDIAAQSARAALDTLIAEHQLPSPAYVDLISHHRGVTAWLRLDSAEHIAPWAHALAAGVKPGRNDDTGAWTLDVDRVTIADGIDVYCYWDGGS